VGTSTIYLIVALVILVVLTVLLFLFRGNKKEKFTPLLGAAFAFYLAGWLVFNNSLVSVGLMGVGVILGTIDTVLRLRKK
jgi:hypothetical protein